MAVALALNIAAEQLYSRRYDTTEFSYKKNIYEIKAVGTTWIVKERRSLTKKKKERKNKTKNSNFIDIEY